MPSSEQHSGLQLSRRSALALLGTSGTLLLHPPRLRADGSVSGQNPHFFLNVYFKGGWDQEYLFDPRPRSWLGKGLVKNYLREDQTPFDWLAANGRFSTAALVAPLYQYRNYFSVLRGVHMSGDFDGHDQNTNLIYAGNEAGGTYFGMNLSPDKPLDGVQFGVNRFRQLNIRNLGASVSLSPTIIRSLTGLVADAGNDDYQNARALVQARIHANASRPKGMFTTGCNQLLQGLFSSQTLGQRLNQIQIPANLRGTAQDMAAILQCFQKNLTNTADLQIDVPLDAHDPMTAQMAPTIHEDIVSRITTIIDSLVNTPFDESRGLSFMDVTTFVVTSEFGRSFKQTYATVETTGTDHNRFNNTYLVGGKGMAKNRIIGETDLDQLTADGQFTPVSGAHLAKDANLTMSFGKPFDVASGQIIRQGSFPVYRSSDYLAYYHVTNTLMTVLGLPSSQLWNIPGTRQTAPVLGSLIQASDF